MKELILREFHAWQNILSGKTYLDLPQELFANDCPPMSSLGGAKLSADQPCLLVISLEPLLDKKTYSQQLNHLRITEEGADSRVLAWQLDYFDVFPKLLPHNTTSTHYWGDISSLVRGWCRNPFDNTLVSWTTLASSYIELPLIPMHAKSHTAFTVLSTETQTALHDLFRERLIKALDKHPHTAVLALGSDCERETRKILRTPTEGVSVPITPHQPQYGQSAERYEREIQAFAGLPLLRGGMLFVRKAPFTNWHRPNRVGIHEIGRCLRNYFDEVRQQ